MMQDQALWRGPMNWDYEVWTEEAELREDIGVCSGGWEGERRKEKKDSCLHVVRFLNKPLWEERCVIALFCGSETEATVTIRIHGLDWNFIVLINEAGRYFITLYYPLHRLFYRSIEFHNSAVKSFHSPSKHPWYNNDVLISLNRCSSAEFAWDSPTAASCLVSF